MNAVGGDNLHRDVIFRDGAERASQSPPLTVKLWEWMAGSNYQGHRVAYREVHVPPRAPSAGARGRCPGRRLREARGAS